METEIQKSVREAMSGVYPSPERMQQIQFHQLNALRRDLGTIAGAAVACAVLLAITCGVVVYKSFFG